MCSIILQVRGKRELGRKSDGVQGFNIMDIPFSRERLRNHRKIENMTYIISEFNKNLFYIIVYIKGEQLKSSIWFDRKFKHLFFVISTRLLCENTVQ